MKKFIYNTKNQILGVEYNNTKLSKIDPLSAAKETGEFGLVVIKNSQCTPEEFAEWSLDYGHHLSPNIWCTDKEHSDLFWRVTNKKVDDNNQGLFGDYELDWHTNLTPVPDAEEVVGLYAKIISYPTETWFCNSIPYFKSLDSTTQSLYKKLKVILDPHRKLGKYQNTWEPKFEEIYDSKVFDDIRKNRNSRQISNCINLEEKSTHLYKPSRGILEEHKFCPNHPLGTNGIFFTPFEIHKFKSNDQDYEHSESLYWQLWNDYVSGDYTYKHNWVEGDICLMDQLLTIHRRPSIIKTKPRELLRLACWYHTSIRQHYDYSL